MPVSSISIVYSLIYWVYKPTSYISTSDSKDIVDTHTKVCNLPAFKVTIYYYLQKFVRTFCKATPVNVYTRRWLGNKLCAGRQCTLLGLIFAVMYPPNKNS